MYKYYGAPAVAFRASGLAKHHSIDDEPVCDVCEIRCYTLDDLMIHETGKKHKMNLEMSQRKLYKASNLVKEIPKVVQPVTCEVCKIGCTSTDVLRRHETGKKHKMYLERLQRKLRKMSNIVKKIPKVVQPAACEVCKGHETCKHKNNLVELQDSITPEPAKPPNDAVGASTTPAAVPDGVMPAVQPTKNKSSAATQEDLEDKKRGVLEAGAAQGELQSCTMSNAVEKIPKVVQAVACEVCKVQCTSLNDFRVHETGKKHKKNLEKFQDSIKPEPAKPPNDAVGASTAPAAAAVADGVIPAVRRKRNKRSAGTPEDLEAKRRRVVARGVPKGGVKICMVCNVVVSSQEDLESHIAGHRHNMKLRKQKRVQPLPQVA